MKYLKIKNAKLYAFIFIEREKDYGGIHLGIPNSSIGFLLEVMDEIERIGPGHSRRLPLIKKPTTLPKKIYPRGSFKFLDFLRIKASTSLTTRISIENTGGIISLSPKSQSDFRTAIESVAQGHGDICLSGDSKSWTDRLFFWPMLW